jgi:hypothetical protein
VLAYDPENLEAILARSKASKAAGRKLEALALLESGDSMATRENTHNRGPNNFKDTIP